MGQIIVLLTAYDVYYNWNDLKWIPEAIKEGVESHSRMQQDPDTFVCFAKGTFVYTSNGLKPIDEIKVGDTTYSFNLKDISLKLLNATKEERNQFEISPANYGIHWPLIDEDLSIKGLINKSISR